MQGLLKVSEDGVTVLASHVNGSEIKYIYSSSYDS
jgi:hypothetical protein